MPRRTNNSTNSLKTPPGVGISELLACDGYCVETNPEILKLWPDEGCDKFAVTWRGGKNLCAKCDKKMKAVMEWGNYITG